MKVLAITFMYNEAPYIKYWAKFYRENGCKLYVIDNCSTDNSEDEYKRLNIPYHKFDTDGSFHLTILQKEADRVIHEIKPDWVVYAGADLFHVMSKPIIKVLEEVEGNQILLPCYAAHNTGEKFSENLPAVYHYWSLWANICMISKYDESFRLNTDDILIDNPHRVLVDGLSVNFGACKPIDEQKEKLERRRKAWEQGLNPRFGKHFVKGEKINWLREKEGLIDVLVSEEIYYLARILNYLS